MNDSSALDRRSLLQLLALSGGALAGLSATSVSAAPYGVDPRLQRAYCSSVFGQLHYWTIGHGDALVLLHQSAQSSAEFAAIAPVK